MDLQQKDIEELKGKIRSKVLPLKVKDELLFEAERMGIISPASAEYGTLRTYIDWVLSLPWEEPPAPLQIDMDKIEQVLEKEYYGQKKVKEQVLEYFSIRKLRKEIKNKVLCFVGPPGTGKSWLAQSIAKALGREFVRISVAGIRDEAEIRGQPMGYIGAMPGKIIRSIREAQSNHLLFLVEDIDKLGTSSLRGEPLLVLMEAFDFEKNQVFLDYYLKLPYDLSVVMFVCTATVLEKIPEHLLDLMEVIEFSGLVEEEKKEIAKNYILPKQLEKNGLNPEEMTITDEALSKIIQQYTLEAGLRNLQRDIETICRKCARMKAFGETKCKRIIPDNLEEYLGPPVYIPDIAEKKPEIGVAIGLAWTAAGGDIMVIEALKMRGSGQVISTGQLGDIIKESIQAAHSFVRSKAEELDIDYDDFTNYDIHIHFPSGSVPKDGSSAGCAICLAIASVMSDKPIRNDIAMSGEVSLRGKILPVLGIKEKVSAAARVGIKNVILPKANVKNISDVPEVTKNKVNFIWVERVEEIFQHSLIGYGKSTKISKKEFKRIKDAIKKIKFKKSNKRKKRGK
jgi:ATP-dependent Lon protease